MCDVTAAAVAATTVAGAAASAASAGKGAKKTETQTSVNEPWAAQQPSLRRAFDHANMLLDRAGDLPVYQGELTAGLNERQKTALGLGVDYANGQGAALADGAAGSAGALMGAATPYLGNAASLAANGAGPGDATASGVLAAAANGMPLSTASAAGRAGAAGQMGALASAQGLAQRAQADPNGALRAAAEGYADPARVQGQVDAALRDVSRNLGESTLPGLNARAAAGGNLNSARAGAAEAVARRGAEDRAADLAAGIKAEAFSTGLNAALTANQQQNALALGANQQAGSIGGALSSLGEGQRQYDASLRLDAATALGSQDLANRSLDADTRLDANAQLGDAARTGLDAAGIAGALADANAGRVGAAGDAQQMEEQRVLDANAERYYRQENHDWQNLQRFYGIVGDQKWGESKTMTTTGALSQPSNVIGGALGGASLGMGMMNGQMGTDIKNYFSGATSAMNNAYASPYGATGRGALYRGSTGMLGGGV